MELDSSHSRGLYSLGSSPFARIVPSVGRRLQFAYRYLQLPSSGCAALPLRYLLPFLPIVLLFLYAFCFNLYCGGFILFCSVCVCACVCVCASFVMCGCFGNMYTVL